MMQMFAQWHAAIQYLEQNLCDRPDLSRAAAIACMSKDNFLRLFSYMTGMTVSEYLRRRRLTRAAYDLLRGEKRIIDLAVKYGYNSADAFTRAFVRQHGVTPAAVRKQQETELRVFPPVSFHVTIEGAAKMDFRIVTLEETIVYGRSKAFDRREYSTREALRHSMWSEEADFVPGQLYADSPKTASAVPYDGIWYGVWHDSRYMLAREAAKVSADGLEQFLLPAGRYAAFRTEPGGFAWEELPRLFAQIESWLPDACYRLRSADIIEVYHLWTDPVLRRRHRFYEVWLPIEAE